MIVAANDDDSMEKRDATISRLRRVCRCSAFCGVDGVLALTNIIQSSEAGAADASSAEEESMAPRTTIPADDGTKDKALWEKEDSISARKRG